MRRMVVTGGSGFVGGAVARAAVEHGWRVTTTSRRPAVVPGARHVRWDLDTSPGAEVVAALNGADVVVHCGAFVGDGGPGDVVRRTTVGGTRRLLEHGAARLVHVSTGSVYDPRRPSVRAHEDEAPVRNYLDPYAAAKADAERLVLGAAGRREVVVLRPHAVYGPGDTTLLPRVLATVRRGVLPLPGGGHVRQHLTALGTLVDAVLAAAVVPLEGPAVVNVADAEPVVLRDALVELLEQRGTRVRVLPVPAPLAVGAAVVGETVHAVTGRRSRPPRLTRYALSHLLHERTYDLTRLREVLGVRPTTTSFDGADTW